MEGVFVYCGIPLLLLTLAREGILVAACSSLAGNIRLENLRRVLFYTYTVKDWEIDLGIVAVSLYHTVHAILLGPVQSFCQLTLFVESLFMLSDIV